MIIIFTEGGRGGGRGGTLAWGRSTTRRTGLGSWYGGRGRRVGSSFGAGGREGGCCCCCCCRLWCCFHGYGGGGDAGGEAGGSGDDGVVLGGGREGGREGGLALAELFVDGGNLDGVPGGEKVVVGIFVDCFEEVDDDGSEAFRDLKGHTIKSAVFRHWLPVDF